MKKIFTAILCLTCFICNGQQKEIEILSKTENDHCVTFYTDRNITKTYTVLFYFNKLENSRSPICRYAIINHPGKIMTLEPTNRELGISYDYTYTYTFGNVDAKHNEKHIYRLPYSAGTNRKSSSLNYLIFGNERKPEDYYSIYFQMEKGDTIFAARKGVVVKVVDNVLPSNTEGYISFSTEFNSITVEHKDGTIAEYSVLEHHSIMVKPGDTVYPNTPIALAGSYNNIDYQVRFSIRSLDFTKEYKELNSKNKFLWKYIKPVFKSAEQTDTLTLGRRYTAAVAPELIRQEMSKKEIKELDTPKK